MSEPSTLVYARHFKLTHDYAASDLLENLHDIVNSRLRFDRLPDFEGCSSLIETFAIAAHEFISLTHDEPLHASQEGMAILRASTSKNDLDFSQIYQGLLPDPYRMRQYKLKVPLLRIGGGDVHRDARRIRKGVDLERVLHDLLEDLEHTPSDCEAHNVQVAAILDAEMLEIVKGQVESAAQKATMSISARSLHYLRDTLLNTVDEDVRWSICQAGLPSTRKPLASIQTSLIEENFQIECGQSPDIYSPQSTLAAVSESEANAKMDEDLFSVEQETADVLCHLDTILGDKILRSDTIPQSDEEMENLFKLFTTYDADEKHSLPTPSTTRKKAYSVTPPPAKRRKLAHDSEACQQTTSPRLPNAVSQSAGSTTRDYECLKLELPDAQGSKTELSNFNLVHLLDTYRGKPTIHCNSPLGLAKHLDKPPFGIPTMQDILKDTSPENIAVLSKYYHHNKSVAILSSSDLLWKEPGLRIFDKDDVSEGDLSAEDYNLSDWDTPDLVPTEPDEIPKSASTFVLDKDISNGRNDIVNIESVHVPAVEDFMPVPEVESVVPATAMSSFELVKPTTKVPRVMPCSTNIVGSVPMPSNLSCYVAKHEQATMQAKSTNTQGSIKRLQNLARKLPFVEIPGPVIGLLANDPLSDFLELRGKKRNSFPFRRASKDVEMLDDPIQSTQNSDVGVGGPFDRHHAGQQFNDDLHHEEMQQEVFPDITVLEGSRTIVLNNALLQCKPLLVQFLERQAQSHLSLIYRDLDDEQCPGPDIVLNATTCLFITNLQTLDQRPLPGSSTTTGLSVTHDRIALLSRGFPRVMVLVHYLTPGESGMHHKLASSLAAFAVFCQRLSRDTSAAPRAVHALHVPCLRAASTSDAVNAWTWQIICQYSHENVTTTATGTVPRATTTLIQDETLWELFLRKAGLNAMAAQIVIGALKRPGIPSETSNVRDSNWGLRKLVAMSVVERSEALCGLVGKEAVDTLNRVLQE